MVSVSRDSMVFVWDVETGAILAKSMTSKQPHSLALNSNDEAFVLGTTEGSLLSFRLRQTPDVSIEPIVELPPRMKVHRDQVDGLSFAADGQSLVTCSRDGTAGVYESFLYDNPWNAATTPSSLTIVQLRALPTGDLVCLQRDHRVELWNASTQKLERRLELPAKFVDQQLVAGEVSGENYVAVTDRGTVVSWQMEDGRILGQWTVPLSADAKPSVSANLMVTSIGNEFVSLIDVATEQTRQSWNRAECRSLVWSKSGKLFAKLEPQAVRIYEWPSGMQLRSIRCDGANVKAIQFSPNESDFAVASDRLRIHRVNASSSAFESDVETSSVRELWYSAAGDRLISSDNSSSVRVWHAQTANLLLEHPTRVKCEQFVPVSSGRFLVYVDRDANKLRRIGPLR